MITTSIGGDIYLANESYSARDWSTLSLSEFNKSTPRSRNHDGSSHDINVKAETINQSPMNNALGDIVTIPPQGDYMLILSMIYRNNNKNIKASTFVIERSFSDYKVVLSVEQ